jgi:hypothetical protein
VRVNHDGCSKMSIGGAGFVDCRTVGASHTCIMQNRTLA